MSVAPLTTASAARPPPPLLVVGGVQADGVPFAVGSLDGAELLTLGASIYRRQGDDYLKQRNVPAALVAYNEAAGTCRAPLPA